MVAEPTLDNSNTQEDLVGVVDVTVSRDRDVLQHLPSEAEEYLYVSGIAVLKSFRSYLHFYVLYWVLVWLF